MIGDARDLAHDDADVLCAFRRLDAEQLLDREREADVVDAGRGVVEPVGVREALRPRALLEHLLEAAMKIADLDVAIGDPLAVELEVELDGAVRRRMGRPHLELHDLIGWIGGLDLL